MCTIQHVPFGEIKTHTRREVYHDCTFVLREPAKKSARIAPDALKIFFDLTRECLFFHQPSPMEKKLHKNRWEGFAETSDSDADTEQHLPYHLFPKIDRSVRSAGPSSQSARTALCIVTGLFCSYNDFTNLRAHCSLVLSH